MIVEKAAAQSWHTMKNAIDELNSNGTEPPVYRAALVLPLTQGGITAIVGAIAEYPSGFTFYLKNTGGAGEVFLICAIDGVWRVWAVTPASGGMPLVSPAVLDNLVLQNADGTLKDAGYGVSQTTATVGSVPRRNASGTLVNSVLGGLTGLAGISVSGVASTGISTSGTGIVGESTSGTGAKSTSTSGTYHHEFGAVSAIARATGVLTFVGGSAVANRAAQRTEIGATTVGSNLFTAATVDGARGVLGLAPQNVRPVRINYNALVFSTKDLIGSGAFSQVLNLFSFLSSGTTANSQIRAYLATNLNSINLAGSGAYWSRRIDVALSINIFPSNADGILEIFIGKNQADSFGAVSAGNYVGIRIENRTLVSGYACAAGTLSTVALSGAIDVNTAGNLLVASNNGSVFWIYDGVVIGSTLAGPTSANAIGTVNYEIRNGAAASNYGAYIIMSTEGY